MSEKPKQCAVVLIDGGIATWSIQNELLILLTDSTSAQWHVESVGINLMKTDLGVKIELLPVRGIFQNYQSWHFSSSYYEKLASFFQSLGYPCPTTNKT